MSHVDPATSAAPRRKRRGPKIVGGIVAALLVLALALGGWYLFRVNQALDAVPRVDFATVTPTVTAQPDAPKVVPTQTGTVAKAPNPAAATIKPVPVKPTPATTTGATATTAPGSATATGGTTPARAGTPEPDRPAVAPESEGQNFLLLGTDYANGGTSRSDSFMVVHVNGARNKVYVISYPRDSYVDIPGYGKGKINWAYQWGGVSLAKRTLEQLSGVGIDHTLHVDFDRFIELTNAVGGVTVDNPSSFSIDGYDFPAGPVDLQGERALKFVRARYGLPRWDLSRAANQRAVVKAIIVKAMRPEMIGNPAKFNELLNDASDIVEVDKGLSTSMVRDLALSMQIRSNDDIVLMQAPISGFGELSNGDSIDVVDWDKMKALSRAIQNDDIGSYVAKYGTKGYSF